MNRKMRRVYIFVLGVLLLFGVVSCFGLDPVTLMILDDVLNSRSRTQTVEAYGDVNTPELVLPMRNR